MRINGTAAPQRQAPEREWTRKDGWVTYDVWVGVEAGILGLVPTLQQDYDNLQIQPLNDGVLFKLRAAVGSANDGSDEDEQEVNTWELLGSGLQESMTQCKQFNTLLPLDTRLMLIDVLNNGGQASQDYVINAVRIATKGDKLTAAMIGASFGAQSPPVTDAGTVAVGEMYYYAFAKGQGNYQESQWVLRHTQTISSRAELDLDMSGINRLWATADLPKDITPAVKDAINAIENPGTGALGYNWSWLKQTPTITETLNGKVQAITEWWLYNWPVFVYYNK